MVAALFFILRLGYNHEFALDAPSTVAVAFINNSRFCGSGKTMLLSLLLFFSRFSVFKIIFLSSSLLAMSMEKGDKKCQVSGR